MLDPLFWVGLFIGIFLMYLIKRADKADK